MPECFLAVVLILVLVLVVILILVLAVLILLVVLVAILVIHSRSSKICTCGNAATIVYPDFQLLSLALNSKLASRPAVIAIAIPPAQAFNPPVKIPRKPSCWIASFTPLARL